jgi:hypothetical protein
MSVRLSACISVAQTGLTFNTDSFYESSTNLVKIGPKQALYVKTKVHIIVAGDIKLPSSPVFE